MQERIVDRVVASFEAEIRQLRAELRAARTVCGYTYGLCNLVISSCKFNADESMSKRLKFVRDEAKKQMEAGGV